MEVFPEIKIVDPKKALKTVVSRVQGFLALGHTTELCLTEHKRGAAEMLDNAMDNQPELPFDKWDDMGCYIDRSRV